MNVEQQLRILETFAVGEATFSELEHWELTNSVAMTVTNISRAITELERSEDPFQQWRGQKLRQRFADTLQQLAQRGVSVPLPVEVPR